MKFRGGKFIALNLDFNTLAIECKICVQFYDMMIDDPKLTRLDSLVCNKLAVDDQINKVYERPPIAI